MDIAFWREIQKERDHLEGLDLGGRIIIKWIFEKQNGGMDWINLAQDRDQWRALANTVVNFGFDNVLRNY
jgi:hypothetical protein